MGKLIFVIIDAYDFYVVQLDSGFFHDLPHPAFFEALSELEFTARHRPASFSMQFRICFFGIIMTFSEEDFTVPVEQNSESYSDFFLFSVHIQYT